MGPDREMSIGPGGNNRGNGAAAETDAIWIERRPGEASRYQRIVASPSVLTVWNRGRLNKETKRAAETGFRLSFGVLLTGFALVPCTGSDATFKSLGLGSPKRIQDAPHVEIIVYRLAGPGDNNRKRSTNCQGPFWGKRGSRNGHRIGIRREKCKAKPGTRCRASGLRGAGWWNVTTCLGNWHGEGAVRKARVLIGLPVHSTGCARFPQRSPYGPLNR